MKTRGLVLDPEVSVDVEPSPTILYDMSRFANNGAFLGDGNPDWARLPSGLWVRRYVAGDYIAIPNHPSLQITGDLTLEAWGYVTGWSTGLNEFFYKHGSYEYEFALMYSGGLVYERFYNGDGAAEWMTGDAIPVPLNTWHHYIVTRTKTPKEIHFYFDGSFVVTRAYTKTVIVGTNAVYLGYRTANYEWLRDLTLQRIYNYALTPGQILQRFEATRRLFGV